MALKWVLPEAGRDQALALLNEDTLLAPDFLILECGNVLATKARQGMMSDTQSRAALRAVTEVPNLVLRPSRSHMEVAHALALELRQTTYDCLYLALALSESRPLLTADDRFASAVERHRVYDSQLRRLT